MGELFWYYEFRKHWKEKIDWAFTYIFLIKKNLFRDMTLSFPHQKWQKKKRQDRETLKLDGGKLRYNIISIHIKSPYILKVLIIFYKRFFQNTITHLFYFRSMFYFIFLHITTNMLHQRKPPDKTYWQSNDWTQQWNAIFFFRKKGVFSGFHLELYTVR